MSFLSPSYHSSLPLIVGDHFSCQSPTSIVSAPPDHPSSSSALFSLLSVDDYRSLIGSKRDIIYALVKSLSDRSTPPRSVKDALRALFGISLHPPNRTAMVELGAVPVLFSLVMRDVRVGIVEDATAVIAQVAGCEASLQAFGKASGIRVLADLLDSATGSSEQTKENAVAALLNLVQSGGVEEVKYAMGFGVLDGIEEVVEHGSEKGKMKASALLKAVDHQTDDSGPSRFDSAVQHNHISV
uniref:U-box domain-containing protein n=1 Tax=Kalanchoe fedtschenkoi TaxID=63787 RepID=A0A7N0V8U8_KALFE